MRDPVRRTDHDGIAIIGMSGRFPGAANIELFWENLRAGVESIASLTPAQLETAGVDPAALEDPRFVPAASVLQNIDLFDAAFFGLSPREAESVDPQHRLFMETSWHALEDAGRDPATFGGLVGVYGGCAMSTYLGHLQGNPEFLALLGYLQIHLGNDKDYLTTRVSYALNLKGPSFSLQTACSSSLLAVAVASDQLLSHQCDMALAGGVCVRAPQETGYYFEPGGIFSPDGHCRVFDERAAGVVFGNGVGVVVLRRLSDALADRDPIYAIIRGWAVNNDGSAKASYAAPSLEGQADVIARAHAHAGLSADTITYVEAHGTGTPVGDPIEIGALTQAFRLSTDRKGFCAVGSVKTNVGHLDPAAGVTSLIKTALSLTHGEIPPSLNCEAINPAIELADSPFYVNTELSPWESGPAPRRAGVSGFGIGGTNVHLVLEEAAQEPREAHDRGPRLYVLSARSEAALAAAAGNLAEHLTFHPGLNADDVAYTLARGRRAMNRRLAAVCHDLVDLVSVLVQPESSRLLSGEARSGEPSVAFMFSGQGSQYVSMARQLYQSEPVFRASLDRCAELLKRRLGCDLRAVLHPPGGGGRVESGRLTQTAFAQPALFAVEYSLAQLWMRWGIQPDVMIGHSIGEYVAACLAGVFDLDQALGLVAERGRLMQSAPHGSMLAASLPEADMIALISDRLDLAAVNEAALSVVSGPTPEIERLEAELARAGVACQRLRTSHAFHSRMMDEVLEPFARYVATHSLAPPAIPYISNVSGALITAEEATHPEYWARHVRQPVRFADGLQRLLSQPNRALLEVGPGRSLCSIARRHLARGEAALVLPSLASAREQREDRAVMLESLAELWLAGCTVNWDGVYAPAAPARTHLPGYPFERRRYWAEVDRSPAGTESVVLREPDIADWFYRPAWEYVLSPTSDAEMASRYRWLLFDDGDLGSHVDARLRADGHRVTLVRRGQEFACEGTDRYVIDPCERAHYMRLLDSVAAAGRLPERILHLWNVLPTPRGFSQAELFEHWQQLGFYSLLYVVQGLLSQRATAPVELVFAASQLVAVTDVDPVCPAKAPLLGACKTVSQEYPHLSCRAVDIGPRLGPRHIRGELASRLIEECGDPERPAVVSYRGRQRWAQVFEPVRIEEAEVSTFPLRERGVYLITGGLGRIGLALAEELARSVRARLALVSRSVLPERTDWDPWLEAHQEDDPISAKIRALRRIEAAGGEVLVLSGDVSQVDELRAIVQAVRARYGRLHGAIHGAGNVTDEGFFGVDEADPDRCERQFQPKVRGAIALSEALRRQQLDFVVLVSSISSVLAGLGYVAYAAANAFLDAFARDNYGRNLTQWLSIDWDTWEFERGELLDADPAWLAIQPAGGIDAFRRILSACSEPQVVVSSGWLPGRVEQWVSLNALRLAGERRERETFEDRGESATTHMAPRNSLEQTMVDLWEETLGIRPVGVLDNFFTDLGGNSLLATQLISRLRSRLGVDLPLRRFFDAPTIVDLIQAMSDERAANLVPAVG